MKKLIVLIFLSVLIMLQSWAQTPNTVTEEQAVEIAQEYVINHNYRTDEWMESATYTANYNDGIWKLFFIGAPSEEGLHAVGNNFIIKISSEGEVVMYFPGF